MVLMLDESSKCNNVQHQQAELVHTLFQPKCP